MKREPESGAASGAVPGWMDALYPFIPRTFRTARGARMSYLDEGPRTEEAVVLVHGNPTWSFYYRDLVRELSPRVRCIAPDHIGMGLSEKPAGYPFTLETRIADLAALVDSLGLKRIHLVVHDWGGAIGLGMAVSNPQRIGRIVILNTAAFASTRIPLRIALCRMPFVGRILVQGFNGFARPALDMAVAGPRLSAAVRRAYLHPYDSWANRAAVHRFVRDIPLEPDHPSRRTLEGVEAGLPLLARHPKLIVWGGRDFCFNDLFLARWKDTYREAPVLRLAEAGHYVLEDGGPQVRTTIASFLTGA